MGLQGDCCDSDQFWDNCTNITYLKIVKATGKNEQKILFLVLFTEQSVMIH